MRRFSTAVAAVTALLAAGVAAPSMARGPHAGPVLLRDVRASSADIPLGAVRFPIDATHPQPDTQIEPSIAVNPGDALNAVAAFQEDRVDAGGDAGNGFATTIDGGRHWRHGYLPGLTRLTGGAFDRASDAVVTFGADPARPGNYLVYASSLVFNDGSGPAKDTSRSGMAINVSHDKGRTWTTAVILEQDGLQGLNDKNWVVVDNGRGAGHTPGRVYVVWDRITPLVYTYCDARCDSLSHWANAATGNNAFYVYNAEPGIGSIPLVLPNGDLGVVFQGDFGGLPGVKSPPTDQPDLGAPAQSQLQYAVARGAGSTPFPAPLAFTSVAPGIASNRTNGVAEQRAGTLPAAAVDPASGEIAVAWEDGRYRQDGLNDIVVSTSTDGVTWSVPHRVNADPENSHINHWNAMVDIAHGLLHVAYRQRVERHGPPTGRSAAGLSPAITTEYQRSADGGLHWSPALTVNKVVTDVGYAAFSRGGAFLGDYNQLAVASNGWVYIVHSEALPRFSGEACNCSFTSGYGHQHQFSYVAVVAP